MSLTRFAMTPMIRTSSMSMKVCSLTKIKMRSKIMVTVLSRRRTLMLLVPKTH